MMMSSKNLPQPVIAKVHGIEYAMLRQTEKN